MNRHGTVSYESCISIIYLANKVGLSQEKRSIKLVSLCLEEVCRVFFGGLSRKRNCFMYILKDFTNLNYNYTFIFNFNLFNF